MYKVLITILSLAIIILSVDAIIKRDRYNSKGERIHNPNRCPEDSYLFNIVNFFNGKSSRRANETYIKNCLKQIGTTIAMYYTDSVSPSYPEDISVWQLDRDLFYLLHLSGSDKSLPKNWEIPKTITELNKSNSPFKIIPKAGDKYTGEANKPLMILKDGFQSQNKIYFHILFEDGHVEPIQRKEAEKYW